MDTDNEIKLFQSLATLHYDQSLAQISITALTSNAGVSRMYYYRHYHTHEDMVRSMIKRLFSKYLRVLARYHTDNPEIVCRAFFEVLLPYAEDFSVFLQKGEADLVQSTLESQLEKLLTTDVMFGQGTSSYWTAFTVGGLCRMICVWFKSKSRESPLVMGRELAKIID